MSHLRAAKAILRAAYDEGVGENLKLRAEAQRAGADAQDRAEMLRVRADMDELLLPADLYRLSAQSYELAVAAGVFEGEHLELIDGLLLDLPRRTPAHEHAVQELTRWLAESLDLERYAMRVAAALSIGDSRPQADIAVCERSAARGPGRPNTALLVVEVASGGAHRELVTRPALYANAVAEYWAVDLSGGRVICHRHPAAGAYRERTELCATDVLAPRALALAPLKLARLFGADRADDRQPARTGGVQSAAQECRSTEELPEELDERWTESQARRLISEEPW